MVVYLINCTPYIAVDVKITEEISKGGPLNFLLFFRVFV